MIKLLMATVALVAIAAPAAAQSTFEPGFYANVGYTHLDGGDDVSLGAATVRAGAYLHPNFASEGELSVGVKDEDIEVGPITANVKHRFDVAIYAVGVLPISDQAQLFARVGFGHTEIEASALGTTASADGKSWNYGVGGQFFFDESNGLRADWTRRDFTEDDNEELDTYSVSYVRRF